VATAVVNVPAGLTGLWQFATSATKMKATIGNDMTSSHPDNSYFYNSPVTVIGTEAQPNLYSDNGAVQDRSWDYLTCYHGIAANGGGDYVNEYTIAMDYVQTSGLTGWNSLYQTAWSGNANDGDLWTDGAGHIGVGDVGYSTLTYNVATPHRIVLSVDNGNFFRAYVDGVLFLDGAGQGIDGRFSLEVDWNGELGRFNLFADDSWEDAWGIVGTVATWGRALTTAEVAGMGSTTTALVIPEPATIAVLSLGGLLLRRKK
jgi:hypothetical protein